jgi:hypothetical protein
MREIYGCRGSGHVFSSIQFVVSERFHGLLYVLVVGIRVGSGGAFFFFIEGIDFIFFLVIAAVRTHLAS